MKKNIFVIIFMLFNLLYGEDWFTTIGMNYPSTKYYTAIGTAQKEKLLRKEAEENLLHSSNTKIKNLITQINFNEDNLFSYRLTRDAILISLSELKERINYSSPFYDIKNRQWYILGYINKNELWNYISSSIKKEIKELNLNFNTAESLESAEDPLNAYFMYKKSEETSKRFLSHYYLGLLINSYKIKEMYEDYSNTIYHLDERIKLSLKLMKIYVEVNEDVDNILKNSIKTSIIKNGLETTDSSNDYNYIIKASVKDNIKLNERAKIYLTNPEINLSLQKDGEELITWSKKEDRLITNEDLSTLKNQAIMNLSKDIKQEFQMDFINLLVNYTIET